ncbi:hypothetical protein HVZ60_17570 [Escherichia coli]|nr:hypothetical protein [Escherichia coli]
MTARHWTLANFLCARVETVRDPGKSLGARTDVRFFGRVSHGPECRRARQFNGEQRNRHRNGVRLPLFELWLVSGDYISHRMGMGADVTR